jgi:hypothetical protein
MKEIKLSLAGKNKGSYVALVDDEDFEYLNQFRWHVVEGRKDFRVARNVSIEGNLQKRIYMARFIMNPDNKLVVDHIDHNPLNNQRNNLRVCTRNQNIQNKSACGVSKYLGVSRIVSHCKNISKDGSEHISYARPKFQAGVYFNNKVNYLGRYETEEEAAMAYDKKAKEIFGEYANLNFK